MDLSIYFQPSFVSPNNPTDEFPKGTLGTVIDANDGEYFPNFETADLAIIGVCEDRHAVNNTGTADGPDAVRQFLYQLYQNVAEVNIVDFGNIKAGKTIEDTYYAIRNVVTELIKKNTIPVIIGGSQDLTYANYAAYEKLEQTVNIVSVDPTIDLGELEEETNSSNYLSRIILHQPNFLFNYVNLGYQTYFVNPEIVGLIDQLYFDAIRLGEVRADLREVEPIVRDADILSIDVSSIKQADAPGNGNASPNGFYGEEACQIARYAGMSDKLTSIGFYEFNPLFDRHGQTAHLVAQMIWYFVDGYCSRKKDFPIADKREYLKYRVALKDPNHELVFYKSQLSDRWWMDVPYPTNQNRRFARHHMVPCSYNDYLMACKEEMPDKWWRAFQKLS